MVYTSDYGKFEDGWLTIVLLTSYLYCTSDYSSSCLGAIGYFSCESLPCILGTTKPAGSMGMSEIAMRLPGLLSSYT